VTTGQQGVAVPDSRAELGTAPAPQAVPDSRAELGTAPAPRAEPDSRAELATAPAPQAVPDSRAEPGTAPAPGAASGQYAPAVLQALVSAAVERGRRRLLALQGDGGTWWAARFSGVGPETEDLLFREFAGLASAEVTTATAGWIRSRQRADGSWVIDEHGRGDLSVSVQAYCALRLAGDQPDDYHMATAAGWIRDAGGLAAAGITTRIWLALSGHEDWEQLPVPPPEAIFLPAACPVRLPGNASLGRPTVVPASVIAALRPRHKHPFSLAELRVPAASPAGPDWPGPQSGPVRISGLPGFDRGLRAYAQALQIAPLGSARSAALRACASWIIAMQQPDGSWRASRSGWLFSLVALHLLGYAFDHPVLAGGVAALDRAAVWTQQGDRQVRRLEIGGPGVRDTALAVTALADAGMPVAHARLAAAGAWLVAEEIAARAGWLAGCPEPGSAGPGAEPGRADAAAVADSAAVLLALRRVRLPDGSGQLPATVCSLRWLASLQRKNGGWGRFAAGPGSSLLTRTPLFDLGDVRDPASVELTGSVLQAISAAGQPGAKTIRHGVTWLLRVQRPDGSWPGDQGSDLPATCAALSALVMAGVVATKLSVARAAGWLMNLQNSDGGWGHCGRRFYGQPPGSGASAPRPTAMAVAALLPLLAAGGEDTAAAVERGVAWLAQAQLPDGRWMDPPARPGSGAGGGPGARGGLGRPDAGGIDMLTAPLSALGRYQAAAGARAIQALPCCGPGQARRQHDPAVG
jgi:squalene-hopene/tetraprenyl-beta-curcumene cyclase